MYLVFCKEGQNHIKQINYETESAFYIKANEYFLILCFLHF